MTEVFFLVKSHMGTPLDWFFFTLKKKSLHFALRPNKSQKKIPLKIGYKIPWTYVLLILKFFDPHQKSYGLRRLFLNGVFVRRTEKSCLNRSSTKFSQWKSIKTCTKILHNVSNDLTERFFWCEKSCGNSTRLRFFSGDKLSKIDLALSEVIKIDHKLVKESPWCFEAYNWRIFFLSKVGYRHSKSESKGCFKLAIYWVAKLKPIL